ncbi:MAG: serine--tRNA ligase [Patescibacteria group bacterium]|nr:serine--tRNA ligase [Patescibacteria group bacterium]
MLNVQFIRENPEKVKKGVSDKQYDASLVDKVLVIDKKRRQLIQELQDLRTKRNSIANAVKNSIDKSELVEEGKKVKEAIQLKESELAKLEEEFFEIMNQIPNLPAPDVKVGKNDSENEEIKKWGDIPQFDFEPLDHLRLGANLGIIDFDSGAKVSGSQFYYLFGDGALLELALVHYAFENLIKEGFVPAITPDLAKSRYYLGTGYLPKGDEAQTYTIEGQDLGLIATAEVTLAGKHADEVILEQNLPIKYVGYSHAFRQEAGAYGKYSKGLYRVHQFTKVEMFIYCTPSESNKMHDYLLELEEKLYQGLGLPYRVIKQCTGDLGAMAARKYDIEVWMPGRNDYGEVTSTSNCTDYQARNLNIKYRTKNGKNEYIHMLNGTAIAVSRTIIAILENYQQKDGSVLIPKALQKWMGKDRIVAI